MISVRTNCRGRRSKKRVISDLKELSKKILINPTVHR